MTQEVKLHEKNNGFDWSIPKGPYEFLNDEQIKSLPNTDLIEQILSSYRAKSQSKSRFFE